VGHLTGGKEEAYQALAERLSRFPVGVVINDTLMEILQLLYTEKEAVVGSKFPIKPRPLAEIAELTAMTAEQAGKVLNGMAEKGLVVDIPRKGTTYYMLSPVVVGFFEYSMMRAEGANISELSSLYDHYFHDKVVAEEIFGSDTRIFRALVYERYIPELIQTEVLDFEKAEAVIRESGGGGLSLCACRHKSYHLGKTCSYPMEDVCTSLGRPAEWLLRRGFARKASVDDLLKNLERSYKLGLVLTCDNVIDEPAYICHCCGCCCGVLQSIRDYQVHSVQPSGFKPQIDPDACLSCDACVDSCHIDALKASEAAEPVLDQEICIGCGVCASACPSEALQMIRQDNIYRPPQNKIAQLMNIAVERKRF
jgi:Pyruvate/2-oxoacid:ferredoxin oxidoreductase delta subunit